MLLRIKVPVDKEDLEVTVTLDERELAEALEKSRACGACVVISRECGSPLHARGMLERVAA